MKNDIQELFICECGDPEHQLIMRTDNDCDSVFCSVHLAPRSFFKRVWNALKYVCGHRSIYGDFDEFIFDVNDAERLQLVVDHLKAFKEKRGVKMITKEQMDALKERFVNADTEAERQAVDDEIRRLCDDDANEVAKVMKQQLEETHKELDAILQRKIK